MVSCLVRLVVQRRYIQTQRRRKSVFLNAPVNEHGDEVHVPLHVLSLGAAFDVATFVLGVFLSHFAAGLIAGHREGCKTNPSVPATGWKRMTTAAGGSWPRGLLPSQHTDRA